MQPKELQKRLTQEQRRQILVMLARGDTKTSIAQVVGVNIATVTNTANRNPELLEKMKDTVNTYRAQKATDILDKSENLIIRKLNKALDDPDKTHVSLDELSRLAKSSYERVRLEQGRATSISASDTTQPSKTSQMDLEQLVEAIKSKDEVELQKIVFRSTE
jgi:IS30 family transposase